MAITNKDRITRMLDHLRDGLKPYVENRLKTKLGARWFEILNTDRRYPIKKGVAGAIQWDSQSLLGTMNQYWDDVFGEVWGRQERAYVNELIGIRNDSAHEVKPFTYQETHRALDTAILLLKATSAQAQVDELQKALTELQRTIYSEQARTVTRQQSLDLSSEADQTLKHWRDIVFPHQDVTTGQFSQSEFAADLGSVHTGQGSNEYKDPAEFFRRTFLTEGIQKLLANAILRLKGQGGDPVIELQTNFGGGKTHSMLALYHLFSGVPAAELPGVDDFMKGQKDGILPKASRVVLVGTNLNPATPDKKKDGCIVRTIWGELAWQLGGKAAYQRIEENDLQGVTPSAEDLAGLFRDHAPVLILMDELVTFIRELPDEKTLCAGTFGSNITFIQKLTEAVKRVPNVLLVASLPSSQIETGGSRGEAALNQMRHVLGRVQSPWQPATAEESFEIVRRRLFQNIDPVSYKHKDAVIKKFTDLYRASPNDFPSECGEGSYRQRMEKSYPIHPQIFDLLFERWGSLEKFQRTRGVLRLMAAVIKVLWERNDASLMILPAHIPLDDEKVQSELVRYLPQGWSSIIASDIDGDHAIARKLDAEKQNYGRVSACRRVARSIFMATAPVSGSANGSIDDRAIKLACTQPGEDAFRFGDALRQLALTANYLYQDATRYWFGTQPSVTRMAEDRAVAVSEDQVGDEILRLLKSQQSSRGDFSSVHIATADTSEIIDDDSLRLILLPPAYSHLVNQDDSSALQYADQILKYRGTAQRINRNTLIFCASDQKKLQDLSTKAKSYLAWSSILRDKDTLNLDQSGIRKAEGMVSSLKNEMEALFLETWQWIFTPIQMGASPTIEWSKDRSASQERLGERVSKKIGEKGYIYNKALGPQTLRGSYLDKFIWSQKNHIGIQELADYCAQYLYMPKLKNLEILKKSIEDGVIDMAGDNFAYASSYDAEHDSYENIMMGRRPDVRFDGRSVLLKADIARQHLGRTPVVLGGQDVGVASGQHSTGSTSSSSPVSTPEEKKVRRFYGEIDLDPLRPGPQMAKIADEVLSHMVSIKGVRARITVNLDFELPEGLSEDKQRVIKENANTLKIRAGFEEG